MANNSITLVLNNTSIIFPSLTLCPPISTNHPHQEEFVQPSPEKEKGEKVLVDRRTTEPTEYVHKQRRTDKMLVPLTAQRRAPKSATKNTKVGTSSSDNSDITGIPKKTKSLKGPQSLVDSDFGYVSLQILDQQDISSSSNMDKHQKPPRTNPVKPRAQVAS